MIFPTRTITCALIGVSERFQPDIYVMPDENQGRKSIKNFQTQTNKRIVISVVQKLRVGKRACNELVPSYWSTIWHWCANSKQWSIKSESKMIL